MKEEQIDRLIDLIQTAITKGDTLGTQLVVEYLAREQYLARTGLTFGMTMVVLLVFASIVCGLTFRRRRTEGSLALTVISIIVTLAVACLTNWAVMDHIANATSPTYSLIESLVKPGGCN